jgi:hypothetical protein
MSEPVAPSYEALPIYRQATALVTLLEKVVRGFSRYHKYELGARLRGSALDVVLLVAKAYRRGPARAPVVVELARVVKLARARAFGLCPPGWTRRP